MYHPPAPSVSNHQTEVTGMRHQSESNPPIEAKQPLSSESSTPEPAVESQNNGVYGATVLGATVLGGNDSSGMIYSFFHSLTRNSFHKKTEKAQEAQRKTQT